MLRARIAAPHPPAGDYRLTSLIQKASFPGWKALMHLSQYLTTAEFMGLSIILALSIAGLWWHSWWAVRVILTESLLAFVGGRLAKFAFHIATPAVTVMPHTRNIFYGSGLPLSFLQISLSFPSGHTFATACLYSTYALVWIRIICPTCRTITVIAGFVGSLLFLAGVSLIYFAAHLPGEVVGGWLLVALVQLFLWSKFKISVCRK